MASSLPAFPRIVFTVLEPLSLIGGWAGATFTPDWFVESQLDSGPVVASDNSRLVALQLGNAYGLLFLAAIAVLYTTTEPKVVRNYLVALLIADIGHVYVCFHVLGPDRFFEISQWNAVTWGNVGATSCLFFTRVAYLLGLFGPDAPSASSKKTQ